MSGLFWFIDLLRFETLASGTMFCYQFCFAALCHSFVHTIIGRKGRLETVDSSTDRLTQCTDNPTSRGGQLPVGYVAAPWCITVLGDGTYLDPSYERT